MIITQLLTHFCPAELAGFCVLENSERIIDFRLDAAFILYRTQSWNGPLQSLNIDADAAVGIAYHISAFVKILQTQTNQPSVAWLSISMVYTLQGET